MIRIYAFILSLFIFLAMQAQEKIYHVYPCDPDSCDESGELFRKEFWKEGLLIKQENYDNGISIINDYTQDNLTSFTWKDRESGRQATYRVVAENNIPILAFSDTEDVDQFPSRIKYSHDSEDRCTQEIRTFNDSAETTLTIRTQYFGDTASVSTYLDEKSRPIKVEEKHFDEQGLSRIYYRTVRTPYQYAWVRRIKP